MTALSFAAGKELDVVGFGANTDDHLCVLARPPGVDSKQRLVTYARQSGGQVPTALIALQRWGLRTAYVGAFGDDEGAARQRASLAAEGVDLRGTHVRAGSGSQTSVILIDEVSGARTVLWDRPNALGLEVGEIDRALLTAGRVLLTDATDAASAVRAAGWARADGTVVVLDVDTPGDGTAALLALSDVVIVSDGFPQRLTGSADLRQALRQMRAFGPALVVVTLGAGGALGCTADGLHYAPAFPVPVVDTTSAGDLFHAGCIFGLLRRWAVGDTLRFAAAAAALECTGLGGRAAIPTLAAVQQLALM
jgi:sugar/nucleoside kinase (ribokinase family)